MYGNDEKKAVPLIFGGTVFFAVYARVACCAGATAGRESLCHEGCATL
jgi:hypothetical protein